MPPMKQHLKVTAHFSAHLRHADLAPYKEAGWLEQRLCWKSAPYKEFYFQILHICTGNFFLIV